jgi:hypothetical protein
MATEDADPDQVSPYYSSRSRAHTDTVRVHPKGTSSRTACSIRPGSSTLGQPWVLSIEVGLLRQNAALHDAIPAPCGPAVRLIEMHLMSSVPRVLKREGLQGMKSRLVLPFWLLPATSEPPEQGEVGTPSIRSAGNAARAKRIMSLEGRGHR